MDEGLRDAFTDSARDDVVERLLDAGVPAAPVWDQNVQDELPQLVARGFHQVTEHAVAGAVHQPGIGIRSPQLDLAYRSSAPLVGEHTEIVVRELLGREGAG